MRTLGWENGMECRKKIHLEILRIIAIVLVVFNHTPAYSFPLSAQASVSWPEFFMLFISIADKVAVPLFFMISGALLLSKKETLSALFKKRVLRMFVVLVFFILIQNGVDYIVGGKTINEMTMNILRGSTPAEATWFLYGYLAFLLMLPLLRILVEKMETQHFLYLVVLHLMLVEFIPVPHTPLDRWLPFTAHSGNLSNIYIYAIMGYYLEHRISIQDVSKKVLCVLGAASLAALLIGAIIEMLLFITLGKHPSESSCCFTGAVLIPGLFIYLSARKLGEFSLPKRLVLIISMLGPACFTVMLTENIFREAISSLLSDYKTEYYPSLCVVLMVCCCGWLCGIFAKRLPYIRKFV